MHRSGRTPGDCGSWQTPTKLSGYRPQTRATRSLQISDHSRLVASVPMWCAMKLARGEKIVRSVPRSRCIFSCAFSRLARISSSAMTSSPRAGDFAGSSSAATCRLRHASSAAGAVV